ncbi:MAG: AAA family ATPase [Fusobacteriaceae bacterium]
MAKFYPEINEIKKKYILLEEEKNLLNHIFKLFKNRDDIEIHFQKIIFNQLVNILIITEYQGIFFITENTIDTDNFLDFFDTHLELNNKKIKFQFLNFLTLTKETEKIIEILNKNFVSNLNFHDIQKIYFKKYYNEIKSKLYSKFNESIDDILINFDSKQEELILRRENFKVKGIAGSGKTAIIVEKCVRDYREFKRSSLIVVFNITARNHIRQKLYNFYKDIDRSYFKIVHYHSMNKEIKETEKFDNIFIDEAQDFQREWYKNIFEYKKSEGNFYIFGDEKQNIYERKLDGKNIVTPLSGAWNQLKVSYRSKSIISELALEFQNKFYKNKYSIDEYEIKKDKKSNINMPLDFLPEEKNGNIEYKYFNTKDSFKNSVITEYIKDIIFKNNFEFDKTAILCTEVEIILPIMEEFKNKINNFGITMETFEEREIFNKTDKNEFDKAIKSIRRNRKLNFEIFGNFIIFSTVHSFKGFERDNIIFVVSEPKYLGLDKKKNINELIYTGITRAKQNLCIINVGLEEYNDFFGSNNLENEEDFEVSDLNQNYCYESDDYNDRYESNNYYDGANEMDCTDEEFEHWFEFAYERYD